MSINKLREAEVAMPDGDIVYTEKCYGDQHS
jgi:hypothetical protein